MRTFEFKLVLSRLLRDDEKDALFENGFDNCTLGVEQGVGVIEVWWQAETYDHAVAAAKSALKEVIPDIEVTSVATVD